MYTNYVEAIARLDAPVKARIITRTPVKMNKKDVAKKSISNPHAEVVKISTMIVDIVPQYEDAVNKQREVEGKSADFVASERKWGKSTGNGVVTNNGKQYVSFIVDKHVLSTYMEQDKIVNKEDLAPFIPAKKPSTTQNVENEITFRTVSVQNIMELVFI